MSNLLIIANIIMAIIFIVKINFLPPQIPLFYSLPTGENQLTDTWMIFLIPFILNIFYIINTSIYNKFFLGNDFIKKIFHYLNLFLIISFTFIFIKIIFLVS